MSQVFQDEGKGKQPRKERTQTTSSGLTVEKKRKDVVHNLKSVKAAERRAQGGNTITENKMKEWGAWDRGPPKGGPLPRRRQRVRELP